MSKGSTLNPSPGPLLKQRRDTAEGCRDRATAFLLESVTMVSGHNRRTLEKTAAAWTTRAELLQRLEERVEIRLAAVELTAAEIADGANHMRP